MTSRRYRSSGREPPFPNIEYLFSLRPTRWKLGLENITRLLALMKDPQAHYPAVLVGGTNGKGSTVTFVASMLREAGLRTGTFYSPHLFRINERIRVNGEEIPSAELDGIAGELRAHRGDAPFTFFEGITAAAAEHFRRRRIDVAVFEVGLGGRLDATRVVHAAVTVVTGISHDHREHLGSTRLRILDEKLGIVRPGVPLVARLGTGELERRAARRCESVGAPFVDVREHAGTEIVDIGPVSMRLRLATQRRDYGEIVTRMTGLHQAANIETAAVVVETLLGADTARGCGPERGAGANALLARVRSALVADPGRAVREGAGAAFMAGRFQVLPGSPRIVVDVSHNAEALAATLRTLRPISPPDRTVIIFGVLSNKELGRFPALAKRAARDIILTPLRYRRSARGRQLLEAFGGARRGEGARITAARGMADAMRRARRLLGERDTLLVLGSHHTVEEAAAYL